jgi:hypothetical protein
MTGHSQNQDDRVEQLDASLAELINPAKPRARFHAACRLTL